MSAPFQVEPFAIGFGSSRSPASASPSWPRFAIAQVVVMRELARRGHQDHADAAPDVGARRARRHARRREALLRGAHRDESAPL
jgi:hypothetical protein